LCRTKLADFIQRDAVLLSGLDGTRDGGMPQPMWPHLGAGLLAEF